MLKKIFAFISLALFTVINNPTFAQENVGQEKMGIKVGVAVDQGFGVTAQFEDKLNVFIGNDGVATDYILKEGSFDQKIPVNWYVGLGAVINWGNSYHYNDSDGASRSEDYNHYAVRVPLGVNYSFVKDWDVYGQIAPDLAFKNKPGDSHFQFGVDLGLGVRYAF